MTEMTRRNFVKTATAVTVGLCACGLQGCILFSLHGDTPEIRPSAYVIETSEKRLDILFNQVPELQREGYAVKIIDSRLQEPLIVVNAGEKGFRALSISCTHNGFEVEYQPGEKLFRCISHHRAEYSLDGDILKGPTEKKLNTCQVMRQDDKLSISLPG